MIRLGFLLLAALAAVPARAEANICNLYQPQHFGQVRVGCPITVFALPDVEPYLPELTRSGVVLEPTLVQDQLTLKVTFEHYESLDSCTLIQSSENRTFNRYVLTWDDLQPGDQVQLDGGPAFAVPGAGPCETPEPWFFCQDDVHFCDYPPDDDNDDDVSGCSATGSTPSWLVLVPLLAFARRRRR